MLASLILVPFVVLFFPAMVIASIYIFIKTLRIK